jgi:hypothetical protein
LEVFEISYISLDKTGHLFFRGGKTNAPACGGLGVAGFGTKKFTSYILLHKDSFGFLHTPHPLHGFFANFS